MQKLHSSDGTAIAFDRAGDGPPLVLVNGALSARSSGAPLTALLAPHYTVFTYDRRGRGDSGDTPPYAVEREIDDLAAVIDEAGGSAGVFGHSSGAVLALEAASRGLAITKLALYEPPCIVDDSRPPLPDDYVMQVGELVAAGRRGDAVALFMTAAVEVPAEIVAQMRHLAMWPVMEDMAHTLAYDGAVMGDTMRGRPLPSARWSSVSVPTLVLDGGASPAHIGSAAQAMVAILPRAQRLTLEGQTHIVVPPVVAPVLADFFAPSPADHSRVPAGRTG